MARIFAPCAQNYGGRQYVLAKLDRLLVSAKLRDRSFTALRESMFVKVNVKISLKPKGNI